VKLDAALGQREPEPGALTTACRARLLELLDDALTLLRRDADPVSRTPTRISPSSLDPLSSTRPPSGVNFTAFDSRLRTTWRTFRSSASTNSMP